LNQTIRETISDERTVELHGILVGGGLCDPIEIIETAFAIIPELLPLRSLLLTKFGCVEKSNFATNSALDFHCALWVQRRGEGERRWGRDKGGRGEEEGRTWSLFAWSLR
jgi:hypothetical protein